MADILTVPNAAGTAKKALGLGSARVRSKKVIGSSLPPPNNFSLTNTHDNKN